MVNKLQHLKCMLGRVNSAGVKIYSSFIIFHTFLQNPEHRVQSLQSFGQSPAVARPRTSFEAVFSEGRPFFPPQMQTEIFTLLMFFQFTFCSLICHCSSRALRHRRGHPGSSAPRRGASPSRRSWCLPAAYLRHQSFPSQPEHCICILLPVSRRAVVVHLCADRSSRARRTEFVYEELPRRVHEKWGPRAKAVRHRRIRCVSFPCASPFDMFSACVRSILLQLDYKCALAAHVGGS